MKDRICTPHLLLLADSGSTKTDWCLLADGRPVREMQTKGINPVYQHEEDIVNELVVSLLPQLGEERPDAICFYGAGCALPDCVEVVRRALSSQLQPKGKVEVCTDMLAAARGLCGHRAGIACILGTGSNSCLYDGEKLVENVSPLGFILGDEGSGACLGKLLVGDILKNQTPPEWKEKFLQQYRLTPADIIERVYRRPFPNRFLASLSPFLAEHLHEPCFHRLVLNSFRAFLQRNVMQYTDYSRYEVSFTGSVAWHYREVLRQAADELGIRLGLITSTPMKGLVAYHSPAVPE